MNPSFAISLISHPQGKGREAPDLQPGCNRFSETQRNTLTHVLGDRRPSTAYIGALRYIPMHTETLLPRTFNPAGRVRVPGGPPFLTCTYAGEHPFFSSPINGSCNRSATRRRNPPDSCRTPAVSSAAGLGSLPKRRGPLLPGLPPKRGVAKRGRLPMAEHPP